jgi:hypothetical protein
LDVESLFCERIENDKVFVTVSSGRAALLLPGENGFHLLT